MKIQIMLMAFIALTQQCATKGKVDDAGITSKIELLASLAEFPEVLDTLGELRIQNVMVVKVTNNEPDNIYIPLTISSGISWYSHESIVYYSESSGKDTLTGVAAGMACVFSDAIDTLAQGESASYFINDYVWTAEKKNYRYAQVSFPYYLANQLQSKHLYIFTTMADKKEAIKLLHNGPLLPGNTLITEVGETVVIN